MSEQPNPFELSDDAPVYVISVAAELSGLHPQTLRAYDRMGLVSPGRTAGRGRRYSMRDILMLREVQRLSQDEGINLAGVKRILELETLVVELHAQVESLRRELEAVRYAATMQLAELRSLHRHDVVPAREYAMPVSETGIVRWRPRPNMGPDNPVDNPE
ncbi:MAG: MerR family transcriptional regulator [Streptosporangiales bacterium]|nr:MerR family transcriptional regulator [Streptosporangiales bacterium]